MSVRYRREVRELKYRFVELGDGVGRAIEGHYLDRSRYSVFERVPPPSIAEIDCVIDSSVLY